MWQTNTHRHTPTQSIYRSFAAAPLANCHSVCLSGLIDCSKRKILRINRFVIEINWLLIAFASFTHKMFQLMFIGFKYLLTFIHTYLYKSISLTAAFAYLPKIFFPKILKKINNYIMDYFVFIFKQLFTVQ